MSKRPARPAGSPWLSPVMTVRDLAKARDFYEKAFGFATKMELPGPDGKLMHLEMTWKDALMMFGEEHPHYPCRPPAVSGTPSPVTLYLYCDDVDALFARAKAAGAEVRAAPENMFWGDRVCQLLDPDGHSWSFGTNVEDFDPSKVPH